MGFKKYINMEQSVYSMPGISGNKGCSEGKQGSRMKTVVLEERAEFGHLHLLPILAQPPGTHSLTSQRREITSQSCCCPRPPGKLQLIHTQSTEV